MQLFIPSHRRLVKDWKPHLVRLLEYGLNGIERILPHTEATEWRIEEYRGTGTVWARGHTELKATIGIPVGARHSVTCTIRRLRVPKGVGAVPRGIAVREKQICEVLVRNLSRLLLQGDPDESMCSTIKETFDEHVVADYLRAQHDLDMDPGPLFQALRRLSGLTYENRALSFGCLIDGKVERDSDLDPRFPDDYLDRKRYRALSDGYHTAYLLSRGGTVAGFLDLTHVSEDAPPRSYFPEWSRPLAVRSNGRRLGLALTRQGDILVFDGGTLRFTYRFGRWQYWNHSHLVDLLKNSARVQRVPKSVIPRVMGATYRAALDVSFRRSGGLFVLLRARKHLSHLVRPEDQIGNQKRDLLHARFDTALQNRTIQTIPRSIMIELAAIDGAVVLSNQGELLAYGAVLEPRRRARPGREEGSRTKAAFASSKYGIAVKVSADGDITVYTKGKRFVCV